MHYTVHVIVKTKSDCLFVFSRAIISHTHAREPLYSNSAVIAWCSQSTGAQNILFWIPVIHSMSQYFTAFNFHDVFSLGIIA